MFLPRFLYDGDAGAGSGGFDIATLPADIQEKIKNYDDLAKFKEDTLSAPAAKTAEEIAKEAELDKVNFRKFSVEKDLMKDEDFNTYESVKGKADRDLVYDGFAKEFKEDHPEIEADELEEKTKIAFENQYHITSTDKTLKTRGEKLLAKEAAELRGPLEKSYTTAKQQYEDDKTMRAKHPEYVKFFKELTKEALPDKITLFTKKEGEEDIPIEVELTEEDKKAVEDKFFKNVKTFQKFLDGKPEEVKISLAAKINSFIRERKMEQGFTQIWEKAHGIGLAKADIGATQAFGILKGGLHGVTAPIDKTARQEVLSGSRRKDAI